MGKYIALAVLALVVLFGLGYGCGALSFRQDCLQRENGIKAQYDSNKNSYDNMWKKFREMAAVPEMYVSDMKKLWSETMTARYGQEGSKALFQFIQEHNPNLDASIYAQLQRAIEAGRNSFKADQDQLIAKKQAYQNVLVSTRALFYNWFFGFPRIDLDKYGIVTSDRTEEVFDTKRDNEPIELRPTPKK